MLEQETFFIGELAARTGVSRDTIRYYESEGVLPEPERNASGYRVYRLGDVERITFLGQAQALGLTLEEIGQILQIVDAGHEPCEHVRVLLTARLEETRDRLRTLLSLERRLELALAGSEASGGACRCHIIERCVTSPDSRQTQ